MLSRLVSKPFVLILLLYMKVAGIQVLYWGLLTKCPEDKATAAPKYVHVLDRKGIIDIEQYKGSYYKWVHFWQKTQDKKSWLK